MRVLICTIVAAVVAAALLLSDDVDAGLTVTNLIVWPAAAIIGLAVIIRARMARQRVRHRRPPHRTRPVVIKRDPMIRIAARPSDTEVHDR